MKYPVVSTLDYKMYIEKYEGQNFFHTDIYKWNKTVRNDFIRDFQTLKQDFPILYAMPYESDDKMIKFGALLGFHIIAEIPCLDGVTRKVFMLKETE